MREALFSGEAVRLPSDSLSGAELEARNGRCKTYRLGAPMDYGAFKELPDDLKAAYIRLLRQRFAAPDRAIAGMLGISTQTLRVWLRRLGCAGAVKRRKWDEEGFLAWRGEVRRPSPAGGCMSFQGAADDVLRKAAGLLGGGRARVFVCWEWQ